MSRRPRGNADRRLTARDVSYEMPPGRHTLGGSRRRPRPVHGGCLGDGNQIQPHPERHEKRLGRAAA
jgi:hypothetical protein